MSSSYTTPKTEIGQGQSIERGLSHLSRYTLKGEPVRTLSPEEMLEIHNGYKTRLSNQNYKEARAEERENNYPETWLNYVISNLIQESNRKKGKRSSNGVSKGLGRKLVKEFKDRGYNSSWLKDGRPN